VADSLTFVGTATTLIHLGGFTLLTDPNFLHAGQRAYLGKGLWSRRMTDPALSIDQLPRLDAVVLSHLHGDHFDRVARRGLAREQPVITTPHAAERLDGWGFATEALETWQTTTLRSGEAELRVTSLPAVHAYGAMGRLLPPVMGSLLELMEGGAVIRSVYVSGDTLTGDHLDEIAHRYPRIDNAVVHLGGTRVLFHTVTMDDHQGVDAVRRIDPGHVVPVHHNDYRVFRSHLSAFLDAAEAAGFGQRITPVLHGETVQLDPPHARVDAQKSAPEG
jgi:L-ascorbate metabolism protein UlaG (beta-lactamase superfamily)